MKHLRLAPGFALPEEAVTQTFGILGKRGVGKTFTASVMAEEMLHAGAQVIVIDPLDVWWGLRAQTDGAPSGLPITVMGGEHGDLPLNVTSAPLLADFAVDTGASLVLSIRHLSKNEQRSFVTAFCERLYHRKGEPNRRQAMHLFIDEADAFAPQRVPPGGERMLGAVDDLVRRGRSSGVGVTLITQRSAAINKDVLTQIEVLVAHRTISPQDRKALQAWVEAHDAHGQQVEFMASLASLAIGEAWVWSPGWLDLFVRVQIRKRRTYDSSRTPKPGERQVAVKLGDIDIEKLRKQLDTIIAKAKEDDPKTLKAEITRLKRELAVKPGAGIDERELARRTEAEQTIRDQKVELAQLRKHRGELANLVRVASGRISESVARLVGAADAVEAPNLNGERLTTKPVTPLEPPKPVSNRIPRDIARDISVEGVTVPRKRILDAIAAFEPLGLSAISKSVAAVYAGASPTSGGFFNNLGRLRAMGLIDPSGGQVALTDAGRELADRGAAIGSVSEVHEAWLRLLPNPQAAILRALIVIYPDDIAKDELAQQINVSATSGGYFKNLGRLRTLGAIEYPSPGRVIATDLLFPVGVPA